MKEYNRLIQALPEFDEIINLLCEGKKICIFEIDVPAHGKKGLYGEYVDKDNYFEPTPEKIKNLQNDTSEAFGHGLCLVKAIYDNIDFI